MQENKPTSLAITAVILLCMFQVTLIAFVMSGSLTSFKWEYTLPIFYSWIDYTLPITFIIALVNSVRIEDDIFLKKTMRDGNHEDLIIISSTNSMITSFVILLVVGVTVTLFEDLGIFMLHVYIFGGFATYFILTYMVKPVLLLINTGVGLLTNWIFNTIFKKHLK